MFQSVSVLALNRKCFSRDYPANLYNSRIIMLCLPWICPRWRRWGTPCIIRNNGTRRFDKFFDKFSPLSCFSHRKHGIVRPVLEYALYNSYYGFYNRLHILYWYMSIFPFRDHILKSWYKILNFSWEVPMNLK